MLTQRSPLERIFDRIEKHRGCWEYQGAKNPQGYGMICRGKHKRVKVHRVAYELRVGPIPEGMCVLHTCDNPCCINPAHLWIGTQGDNSRDRQVKGRTRGIRP
jgi:hypothetical protein